MASWVPPASAPSTTSLNTSPHPLLADLIGYNRNFTAETATTLATDS